ncbi:MAG: pyruvate ferredoxin oxidoreductase [Gammaproteobacteria bacterium]|nr:MAG: pyruvate ferredoxin oxidoreductase [Gammaproteobacteria bacterium]
MSTSSSAAARDRSAQKNTGRAGLPTNVLVVGVGGQGVVMISKVLAQVCQEHEYQVKQSEVHGMAKRGGVVFSHVRFGSAVHSPTIPMGEADVLLALEWAEGLRWLPYLNWERGTFIADTKRIVPPFACRNRHLGAPSGYTNVTVDTVRSEVPKSFAMDASGLAEALGNVRVANTALLGALSTALDFPIDEWKSVLDRLVPPHTVEINRRAFDAGREWALGAPEVEPSEAVTVPAGTEFIEQADVQVHIEAAWCKGCDICVKICPERCLALDDHDIAYLSDPQACTGCHVCEWLCPDFAIRVQRQTADASPATNPNS